MKVFEKLKRKLRELKNDRRGSSGTKDVVGIFVMIIVGAALLEPMAYDIYTASTGNLSNFASAVTITNLIPMFFGLLVLAAAIAQVLKRL